MTRHELSCWLRRSWARSQRKRDAQAERRRQLYRTDPLWRLSKLKDNRERRMRAKRRRA